MRKNTCCFFGHRKINETEELKSKLIEIIDRLIVDEVQISLQSNITCL